MEVKYQNEYRKCRTRSITKREVGNGVSCDMFSLEETDAFLNWQKCPNEPNTFIIDGVCYMFVGHRETFNNAISYCKSKNGRLFEPRTVHTNKLVHDKGCEVLNNKSMYMWVGIITKTGKSGPWKFASSGENVVQTIWYSDQPNDDGSEVCGYYHSRGAEKWYDEPCTRSFRFICEFV